jgi:hypothetical protein
LGFLYANLHCSRRFGFAGRNGKTPSSFEIKKNSYEEAQKTQNKRQIKPWIFADERGSKIIDLICVIRENLRLIFLRLLCLFAAILFGHTPF